MINMNIISIFVLKHRDDHENFMDYVTYDYELTYCI